jgi:hypothetical protein
MLLRHVDCLYTVIIGFCLMAVIFEIRVFMRFLLKTGFLASKRGGIFSESDFS